VKHPSCIRSGGQIPDLANTQWSYFLRGRIIFADFPTGFSRSGRPTSSIRENFPCRRLAFRLSRLSFLAVRRIHACKLEFSHSRQPSVISTPNSRLKPLLDGQQELPSAPRRTNQKLSDRRLYWSASRAVSRGHCRALGSRTSFVG